jgi:hypothetical protein
MHSTIVTGSDRIAVLPLLAGTGAYGRCGKITNQTDTRGDRLREVRSGAALQSAATAISQPHGSAKSYVSRVCAITCSSHQTKTEMIAPVVVRPFRGLAVQS